MRQILTLVRRNLTHIKRQPEMLTDVTIQPVMFVLLFAYVFGGSINVPGVDYKPWLLPGIMAQTIAFSAFIVAIGLNTDIGKGMVDRLRSLPIRRSSILVSRSIAAPHPLEHRRRGHVGHRAVHRLADRRGRRSRGSSATACCCSSGSR